MTKRKIKKIIKKHQKWLNGEWGGKCANFKKKNLKNIDFSNVDLSYADFSGAKLYGANFTGSKLTHTNFILASAKEADFSEADLTFADFYGANLQNAKFINSCSKVVLFNFSDLFGADFTNASLHGTKFTSSNLNAANMDNIKVNNNTKGLDLHCPAEGSFIGYKKASNYIVKLEIPKSAMRSSATSNACRCDRAKVLSITKKNGKESKKNIVKSTYDPEFVYEIGKISRVKNFDENRWNEATTGIHFYMTRQEAVDW